MVHVEQEGDVEELAVVAPAAPRRVEGASHGEAGAFDVVVGLGVDVGVDLVWVVADIFQDVDFAARRPTTVA